MPSTQQTRGAVAAFLDAKASWIKGNLGRKQRDIAADLYNELKDERPSCSVDSINVALTRWLQKQGLSGRMLQARTAAAVESYIVSQPLPTISDTSGTGPRGESSPAAFGDPVAVTASPAPALAQELHSAGLNDTTRLSTADQRAASTASKDLPVKGSNSTSKLLPQGLFRSTPQRGDLT